MKNITDLFAKTYTPYKALLFYRSYENDIFYVESYDMDALGKPINAHPLSVKECGKLAENLTISDERNRTFLQPEGFLPQNVLYLNTGRNGSAVWFTPKMKRHLCFKGSLSIADGEAFLPPLLWKASKNRLSVWALGEEERPCLSSVIYFAPFFNTYDDGRVCMGNVKIDIPDGCGLEKFMVEWERCYFGSAFSHLLQGISPVKGNIVQLWQNLIGSGKYFPKGLLKKFPKKLKEII
ncbi:PRTRC system protein B [Pedobacter sp. R-06]|uniref:PRTRC system protein B n=1 Tax=Pedobacter sp. R-06 TaxID=3404051 RepID=UPI003CE95576